MIRLTNARHADWLTDPDMRGHVYAKEQMDKAIAMLKKYTKTPAQKRLAKIAFVDSTRWNYWCNSISNSYIALVRYALRRIDKKEYVSLLCNIDRKHPMWKTPFLRYLEFLAATKDEEAWMEVEVRARRYFMPVEEAVRRVKKYRGVLIAEFA